MANVGIYRSLKECMNIFSLKVKTKGACVLWQPAVMICLFFYKQTEIHLITKNHHQQL